MDHFAEKYPPKKKNTTLWVFYGGYIPGVNGGPTLSIRPPRGGPPLGAFS